MVYKRGEIYLANFNPSKGTEAGKIRPCLIMQSDFLNEIGHPSTTVLPLTTQLIDNSAPLRYRIKARDSLKEDSEVMLDQARTIDNQRIMHNKITTLNKQELIGVEELWQIILGFGE
ncbi:MAG: type II toxin-antitoxin system PemK/MazF family toxin [Gammaproteobacteria bacterium]|nr:type II toxin-antitoxin system PemK/MazF family toxin [Gammaproteobacteria bacterium]